MLHFANPAGTPAIAALLPLPVTPAVRWTPSDMISGWEVDGSYIRFPIASLPGLTAGSADGLSGDARQVAASFNAAIFQWYNELATKPTALVPKYTPGQVMNYGNFTGAVKAEFRTEVYLNYPAGTITSE
jgi:hypothetical protein